MPEESNNTNEEIINKIEEDKVETPVQPVKRKRKTKKDSYRTTTSRTSTKT